MKVDFQNKKTQIVIIVSVLLLVIGLILYFTFRKKKTTDVEIQPGTTPAPGIDQSGTVNVNEISQVFFPLKKGSQNDYVRILQTWLNAHGGNLSTFGIDGDFGTETETACLQVLGVKEVTFEKFKSLFA